MIIIGAGLHFIPGILSSFFGFYLGQAISTGLEMLSYVSIPLFILGLIIFFTGKAKKRKLAQESAAAGEVVAPVQRTRKSLIGWNILAVILSLPVTFAIIFAGGMAGAPGPSAYAGAYTIMGFGALYFLFTLFCIYMSQAKRSLKWTVWPMIFPAILIGLSMLAPLIILPILYSAGLR